MDIKIFTELVKEELEKITECHLEIKCTVKNNGVVVFCKYFLHKVAKSFCRLLHLHFVGNCKTPASPV